MNRNEIEGMVRLVANELNGEPTCDQHGRIFSHYDHEGWPVFVDPPKPSWWRRVAEWFRNVRHRNDGGVEA